MISLLSVAVSEIDLDKTNEFFSSSANFSIRCALKSDKEDLVPIFSSGLHVNSTYSKSFHYFIFQLHNVVEKATIFFWATAELSFDELLLGTFDITVGSSNNEKKEETESSKNAFHTSFWPWPQQVTLIQASGKKAKLKLQIKQTGDEKLVANQLELLQTLQENEKLFQFILHPSLTIPICISECITASEFGLVAGVLIRIFDTFDMVPVIIKSFIKKEIQYLFSRKEPANTGTLLRSNSLAIKMVSEYSKCIGYSYLREILTPILGLVLKKTSLLGSLEVDPLKMTAQDDQEINMQNLRVICQDLIDRIFETAESCPLEIRAVCSFLKQIAKKCFSEESAWKVALAGYIFLRVISPACVNPEAYQLDENEQITPEQRRSLILITKVIQNLSNGVDFKETYLEDMNSFISENTENLTNFFSFMSQVSDIPPEQQKPREIISTPTSVQNDIAVLSSFIVKHSEYILDYISKSKPNENRGSVCSFGTTSLDFSVDSSDSDPKKRDSRQNEVFLQYSYYRPSKPLIPLKGFKKQVSILEKKSEIAPELRKLTRDASFDSFKNGSVKGVSRALSKLKIRAKSDPVVPSFEFTEKSVNAKTKIIRELESDPTILNSKFSNQNNGKEETDEVFGGEACVDISCDLVYQLQKMFQTVLPPKNLKIAQTKNLTGSAPSLLNSNGYGSLESSPKLSAADVTSLQNTQMFVDFLQNTTILKNVSLEEMTGEQTKAFFINTFNALMMHANILIGLNDDLERKKKNFWEYKYIIGTETYSLNDILNGILRGNPQTQFTRKRPFRNDDPKRRVVLELDPRIHFVLCQIDFPIPVIPVITTVGLDETLEFLAQDFCTRDVDIKENTKEITVSRIFQTYSSDFGKNKESVVRTILKFLPTTEAKICLKLIEKNFSLNYRQDDKIMITSLTRMGSNSQFPDQKPFQNSSSVNSPFKMRSSPHPSAIVVLSELRADAKSTVKSLQDDTLPRIYKKLRNQFLSDTIVHTNNRLKLAILNPKVMGQFDGSKFDPNFYEYNLVEKVKEIKSKNKKSKILTGQFLHSSQEVSLEPDFSWLSSESFNNREQALKESFHEISVMGSRLKFLGIKGVESSFVLSTEICSLISEINIHCLALNTDLDNISEKQLRISEVKKTISEVLNIFETISIKIESSGGSKILWKKENNLKLPITHENQPYSFNQILNLAQIIEFINRFLNFEKKSKETINFENFKLKKVSISTFSNHRMERILVSLKREINQITNKLRLIIEYEDKLIEDKLIIIKLCNVKKTIKYWLEEVQFKNSIKKENNSNNFEKLKDKNNNPKKLDFKTKEDSLNNLLTLDPKYSNISHIENSNFDQKLESEKLLFYNSLKKLQNVAKLEKRKRTHCNYERLVTILFPQKNDIELQNLMLNLTTNENQRKNTLILDNEKNSEFQFTTIDPLKLTNFIQILTTANLYCKDYFKLIVSVSSKTEITKQKFSQAVLLVNSEISHNVNLNN